MKRAVRPTGSIPQRMGGSWIAKWILTDIVKYSYLEGRLVFFFDSHNICSSLNMFMKRGAALYLLTLAVSLSLAFYLDCKFFTAETIFHPLCMVSVVRGYCPWLRREGNTNNNISWLGAYRGYHYYKLQTKRQLKLWQAQMSSSISYYDGLRCNCRAQEQSFFNSKWSHWVRVAKDCPPEPKLLEVTDPNFRKNWILVSNSVHL